MKNDIQHIANEVSQQEPVYEGLYNGEWFRITKYAFKNYFNSNSKFEEVRERYVVSNQPHYDVSKVDEHEADLLVQNEATRPDILPNNLTECYKTMQRRCELGHKPEAVFAAFKHYFRADLERLDLDAEYDFTKF